LIPYFALLTIYGCDALPISSFFVSPSNSNSTVSSASGCSDKPTVEFELDGDTKNDEIGKASHP
ncbi:MAG: hypothetical protein ACKPKG_18950, partial [Dolichospermum sp.]